MATMEQAQGGDLGGRISESSYKDEQSTRLLDQEETVSLHDSDVLYTPNGKRPAFNRLYVFIISLITFAFLISAVYLVIYGFVAPESEGRGHASGEIKAEEYCTTWPVDESGFLNASTVHRDGRIKLDSHAPLGGWQKPSGVRIIAVIFYGRRRNVDILDCYLQQNLAQHGGYLDEVHFLVHTNNKDDLEYLVRLASQTESYRIKYYPHSCQGQDYSCLWTPLVEDDTIYIKLDDDIIYIHHDAIPQLVHTRIKERHPLVISANIVNQPVVGLEHFHFGAIHSFVPEPGSSPSYQASEAWRPSEKPLYPETSPPRYKDHNPALFQDPPYTGHTWLLLPGDNSFDLQQTPVGINFHRNAGLHDLYISAWQSWAIGAQQQYSLLRNIELNQVSRYFFGTPIKYIHANGTSLDNRSQNSGDQGPEPSQPQPGAEQLFDTQYKRTNIIFIAMWGHDIKATLPLGDDDELALTIFRPRTLRRPFVVDTRSVVGHYSYGTQIDGIRRTDLLDRWRALANEIACPADNRKVPWDKRCPGF